MIALTGTSPWGSSAIFFWSYCSHGHHILGFAREILEDHWFLGFTIHLSAYFICLLLLLHRGPEPYIGVFSLYYIASDLIRRTLGAHYPFFFFLALLRASDHETHHGRQPWLHSSSLWGSIWLWYVQTLQLTLLLGICDHALVIVSYSWSQQSTLRLSSGSKILLASSKVVSVNSMMPWLHIRNRRQWRYRLQGCELWRPWSQSITVWPASRHV